MISQLLPFAVALPAILWAYNQLAQKLRPPYPPGPKPYPFIGNLLDFPYTEPWITYDKWKREYGNIVHLNLMGRHLVVLNSMKSCIDLLEKRSAIYSDRPRSVMMWDLMGWDYNFTFMCHDARWRATRRMFSQFFNEHAVVEYRESQERHVHTFLIRLLSSPSALQEHIRLLFAELTMDVVYGIDVKGMDDIYVKTAEEAMRTLEVAGTPGYFLVDTIPALKYVPSWFPGANFKRLAAAWRVPIRGMKDLPCAHVKEGLEKGTIRPSIMTAMLERCDDKSIDTEGYTKLDVPMEEVAASAASGAYAGGVDTTLSLIQMFFFLMAKHPDVQRTAQAELDSVIGNSRLPSIADRDTLPYVQAVMKEVMRYHPVLPLSVVHSTSEDDTYEGYLIPKGTIMVPNVWSILRNPELYPDPHVFNPARWHITDAEGRRTINKALPDPDTAMFGFGRRICPGRYFAADTFFTIVSYVLTCFDISPLSGKPEDMDVDMAGVVLVHPAPYEVSVKPRSADTVQLIGDLEGSI